MSKGVKGTTVPLRVEGSALALPAGLIWYLGNYQYSTVYTDSRLTT